MNSRNQTCIKFRPAQVFNYHCQHYIYNAISLSVKPLDQNTLTTVKNSSDQSATAVLTPNKPLTTTNIIITVTFILKALLLFTTPRV